MLSVALLLGTFDVHILQKLLVILLDNRSQRKLIKQLIFLPRKLHMDLLVILNTKF